MESIRERGYRAAVLAALIALTVFTAPQAAEIDDKGGGATVVVDLNRAAAEELESIPGIGPALAKRIVQFREENGPFRRVEDIMKVRGIGEKSFQKIKPFIKVEKPKR